MGERYFLIIIIYFLNIVDVKNCGSSKSHVTSSKEVNNFGFIVCVYIYIKLGNTKVMINDKFYIYIYIGSVWIGLILLKLKTYC